MFVYAIQPVVKPVVKPVVQPGVTTDWTNSCSFNTDVTPVVKPVWRMYVYTIQPVVKPVVQPVVLCKRGFRIQNGWTFLVPSYTALYWKQAITLVSVLTIQLQVKEIQITLNANRHVVSPVQNAQQHVDTIWPDQANTAELNGQQPWRWYCYHCVQEDELTKPVNGMQCCYQYLQ